MKPCKANGTRCPDCGAAVSLQSSRRGRVYRDCYGLWCPDCGADVGALLSGETPVAPVDPKWLERDLDATSGADLAL
jgi:hypothetical protein